MSFTKQRDILPDSLVKDGSSIEVVDESNYSESEMTIIYSSINIRIVLSLKSVNQKPFYISLKNVK